MDNGEQANILMVDDQPGKLLTLEAILSPLGQSIIKANSAREALDRLLANDVAVILIDVCMPELDGFELAQMIREHPRFHRTAIIFISAVHLTDADRIRGYHLGAVDYISVPIIPEVLRAKVALFMELHRKSAELQKLNEELETRVRERTSALEASTAKLSDSEERLNLALDSAGAASWDWDVCEARLRFSPRYRKLYGLADGDPATLESWLGRLHVDHRQHVLGRLKAMIDNPGNDTWNEEFRIVHPTLGLRWLSSRGRLVRDADNRAIRLTGIDLDVTDRKQAEEDRAQLLEREREARTSAEQANRLKDEFLATVSHELRNPINTVLLWVQLGRRGKFSIGTFNETLDGIERGVRSQTRLIDDLMDISRITAGKLRIEVGPVQLRAVVQAALDAALPAANAKEITVRVTAESPNIALRGDATRLQQVVGNLLDNAIKFTPKGGHVEIALEQKDRSAVLSVSDTGLGIAPAFLPYVFDRFRQADSSTTRRYGGLGLGLAIVKHIVDMHQGEVSVHSDGPDRGSRFVVTIPLNTIAAAAPEPRAVADSEDLTGIRALIVDDDPDTRELLARLLQNYRAEACAASGVDDALARIGGWDPHVLISDIGMPDRDGYALIRNLRASDRWAALPALALTAFARQEDRAAALSAGFDGYVTKPVNALELISMVAMLVGKSSPRRG